MGSFVVGCQGSGARRPRVVHPVRGGRLTWPMWRQTLAGHRRARLFFDTRHPVFKRPASTRGDPERPPNTPKDRRTSASRPDPPAPTTIDVSIDVVPARPSVPQSPIRGHRVPTPSSVASQLGERGLVSERSCPSTGLRAEVGNLLEAVLDIRLAVLAFAASLVAGIGGPASGSNADARRTQGAATPTAVTSSRSLTNRSPATRDTSAGSRPPGPNRVASSTRTRRRCSAGSSTSVAKHDAAMAQRRRRQDLRLHGRQQRRRRRSDGRAGDRPRRHARRHRPREGRAGPAGHDGHPRVPRPRPPLAVCGRSSAATRTPAPASSSASSTPASGPRAGRSPAEPAFPCRPTGAAGASGRAVHRSRRATTS